MSRRRAVNPSKAISITMPQVLLDKLDDKLSFDQSRSAWISGAVRMRLDGSSDISELPTKQLMAAIHARDDINGEMRGIISYWISQL